MEENKILLLEEQFKSYKEQTEKTINKLENKLIDHEKRIVALELANTKTDLQYQQIIETLKKLNEQTIPNLTKEIEELKNKPVKRYDQIVTGILGAIAGAIGSAIFQFFKNNPW